MTNGVRIDETYIRYSFVELPLGLSSARKGFGKNFRLSDFQRNLPRIDKNIRPGYWSNDGRRSKKTYVQWFKDWYSYCERIRRNSVEKISTCFWLKIKEALMNFRQERDIKSRIKSAYRRQWRRSYFLLDNVIASYFANYIECDKTNGISKWCPNPCGLTKDDNPCLLINNVQRTDKNCVKTNKGLFENDFYCKCEFGFEWARNVSRCIEINLCNPRQDFKTCQPNGTLKCVKIQTADILARDIKCECLPEYEGVFCNKPRNACNTQPNGYTAKYKGNFLCRVKTTDSTIQALKGAACIPQIGSPNYDCTCPEGFYSDPSIRLPNCYSNEKNKILESPKCNLVCKKGYCALNSYGIPQCICAKGYRGEDCGYKNPQWEQWAEWSATCKPCQRQDFQKRMRRRRHNGIGINDYPQVLTREGLWVKDTRDVESENCPRYPCIIHGKWGEWQKWSQCTKRCQIGQKTSMRSCIFDMNVKYSCKVYKAIDCIPVVKGLPCKGPTFRVNVCNLRPCRTGEISDAVVRGSNQYGNWRTWSKCSEICGEGLRIRMRDCPLDSCFGTSFMSEKCFNNAGCLKKKSFENWQSWSLCNYKTSKAVGNMTKQRCFRQRECKRKEGCAGVAKVASLCVLNYCLGDSETFYVSMLYGIRALKAYKKNANANAGLYPDSTQQSKPQNENRILIYIVVISSFIAILVLIGLFLLFRELIFNKRKEKIFSETEKTLILEGLAHPPGYGLISPLSSESAETEEKEEKMKKKKKKKKSKKKD
ncbi:DgyrCDS976 [Dimorphilus gyrociliatus]|uniref:DgyrCDS976 n=1 Tax=Dimorphilus gyrociliatus TaxID=2664684 RepID=A0A7I8V7E3_9ANNE|nr:DgyrCDS976 [Dimorphilus gyrociliatus]